MRVQTIVFFLVLVIFFAATGYSEINKTWAKVQGNYISLDPLPDGGTLLLSDNNKVVEINSKGDSLPIVFPQIPLQNVTTEISSQSTVRFCDLAVSESKVTFCEARIQALFSIDYRNPKAWEVLSLKGTLPAKNMGFFRIARQGNSFRLQSLDGNVYVVSPSGETQKLPPRSILSCSPSGENLLIAAPKEPQELNSWKILSADGKEILARTAETAEKNILDLKILGYDSKGRLIFIEVLGKGEKNNHYILNALENGKIVASQEIEGPGELLSVKNEIILSDGNICCLRFDPETKDVKVIKIDLIK